MTMPRLILVTEQKRRKDNQQIQDHLERKKLKKKLKINHFILFYCNFLGFKIYRSCAFKNTVECGGTENQLAQPRCLFPTLLMPRNQPNERPSIKKVGREGDLEKGQKQRKVKDRKRREEVSKRWARSRLCKEERRWREGGKREEKGGNWNKCEQTQERGPEDQETQISQVRGIFRKSWRPRMEEASRSQCH